jgi:predicted N-acetyltransferase YhbS
MGRMSKQDARGLRVRLLKETELDAADRMLRLAFGTQLGLERPEEAFLGADPLRSRYRADPSSVFGAEQDGVLVGSNVVSCWGSFGFFGPLSVDVDHWGQGVAKRLVAAALEHLVARGVTQAGLFTFPDSVKHLGLYTSFGFWPQHLVAILEKQLAPNGSLPSPATVSFAAEANAGRARSALDAHRQLAGALYRGLDLEREVRSIFDQHLGDTLLLSDAAGTASFALCHIGSRSEAGEGRCYVKFAAARPGRGAAKRFEHLIDACEAFAMSQHAGVISAGASTACEAAHTALLRRGWRVTRYGVTMARPNRPVFNRPELFVLCDLR